jgi:hypothetical protein
MSKTTFFMGTDTTDDRVPDQNLDPYQGFAFQAAANLRTINGVLIADKTFTHRGSKSVLWSSEGYTFEGGASLPALTAPQKLASGTHNTNAGGTAPLDLSPYRSLLLLVSLATLSGGSSPSIQFGLNFLDDTTPTAESFPVWSPSALTAAGKSVAAIGPGCTNAGSVAMALGPNGAFFWTVAGGPTTCEWKAWLYGVN